MKPNKNSLFLPAYPTRATLMRLGSLLVTGSVATAANLYWDTNNNVDGSGNAGGSWEGSNWSVNSTGTGATLPAPWVSGESAVFSAGTDGTGAWTVNLSTTVNVASITFEEATGDNGKTISGSGTINIGGGTINSSAWGAGTSGNNGRDMNMNVILAGTGGLTIAAHGNHITDGGGGGGSEFRLGANNTFSGGLTVTSGLVSWTTDANLGDINNIITLNGGGSLCTGASHTTARTFRIGSAGGTFRNYGSTTVILNGPIENAPATASAPILRTDGGTLRINTQGTGHTGTFRNGGGTTQLSAVNADWAKTDFTVAAGNLTFNGTGTAVANSINSSADVIMDNGTTLNVDTGAITMGTAHWYKTNTGSLGTLTSSSGTLAITNGAATGNLTTTDHQIQVRIADIGATPVTLVKNNNNSLVLGQANTYTGGTTINGGRLQPNLATSLGTGTVTVANGGQLFLTSSVPYTNNITLNGNGITEGAGTLGALRLANTSSVTGTVNIASAARITTYSAADIGVLSGTLTGTAPLEKTGSGILSIGGNATGYTGTVTGAGGILNLAAGGTLGGNIATNDLTALAGEGTVSGTLTLGATTGIDLYVNGATTGALTTNNLTVNGTTVVRATSLPLVPGSTFNIINYTGTLTMPGVVADSFSLYNASTYRGEPVFNNTGTAITLTIPAGANLTWKGTDSINPTVWDNSFTANWKNGVTDPDYFYAGDNVLFDDTGATKTVAMQGLLSPASVTFNNSTGNDYSITPNGGTFGFTGATSIVKNGTGTTTIQGYGHNYTGTVTINAGVLQPNGNYELLGNSSGVFINNGGQLNINGMNLGNGSRHYSATIAGAGANNLGAITNSSGTSVNENAGFLNLTLSGNASVGGTGGRFDIGRSGGSFGSITGNGNTLTKVGSNTVCMRAPASNLTYLVSAGTLKFEDSDVASGPNAITVNGGTLQSYGSRTFANALSFANGTSLDNDGGGNQTWTGPITLTGTASDNVNLSARNGALFVSGAISGASNLTANSNNILYLTGSASNTHTGNTSITSTGQLVLGKTGGAVAIPGDLYLSSAGTRAIVSTTENNQFGANSLLHFTAAGDSRLELKGTTQTVAGLDYPTDLGGYKAIQHSEYGTPTAIDSISDLIINVQGANSYTYGGVLRDQGGKVNVTKTGTGTQVLAGNGIDYTGTTTVSNGRLVGNGDDAWTSVLTIASGAVYEASITSPTEVYEQRFGGFTLNGTGTYVKSGTGTMSISWDGGANIAMSPGALIDIQGGVMRLEYGSQSVWTNNKADMAIAAGASLDLWDNNNGGVFVDALNGDGAVTRTNYGQTGTITVGVDNGSGTFNGTISNASGKTHVVKNGTGTQTLGGVNTYTGNTTVNGGTLALATTSSTKFVVTDVASNQITGSGTVTLDGAFDIDVSAVTVTNGVWPLVNAATLTETFGASFTPGAGWTEASNVWTKVIGANTWTFSEATGQLSVGNPSTYASWIDGYFPGETNPAIVGANADPDNDGVANAVEMVLGGDPKVVMDVKLLPTIELVTDPAGVPAGSYLLFTYRRTDLSVASGLSVTSEYDADLIAPWSVAQDGVAGVKILVDDNYGSFVPPAANTDRVRVFVPRAANAKLFGRLKVTTP